MYSLAHIKHYATKSTEEFSNKLIKGAVYSNNTNNKNYMVGRILYYYFYFNKITRRKIELFEKKLNITLNYGK